MNQMVVLVAAVFTICYQLLFFFIASSNRFDKVTDFAGGSNFLINAILTLCLGGIFTSKRVLVTCLVCIWAIRLSGFLLIRVLKQGDDKRFDKMRDKPLQFLVFWVFQMVWVYTVGIGVTLLNAGNDQTDFGEPKDIAGLCLFIIGLIVEAVADQQKFNYRFYHVAQWKEQYPEKTPLILKTGLWRFSRQPNYFGEILVTKRFNISFGGGSLLFVWMKIMFPLFLHYLLHCCYCFYLVFH